MDASKTTWRQKAVSLMLAFVLGFGLSPFGTTPAYASPTSDADGNALVAASEGEPSADELAPGESAASGEKEAPGATGALAGAAADAQNGPAQAEKANALANEGETEDVDSSALPTLTIKGLHSAQIASGKLYTFTDGVRGETDLLAETATVADGYALMYENIQLAAGDYWFEAFDASGYDNGGIKVSVPEGEAKVITVHRAYDVSANNSGWVKDTDYSISASVKGPDGTDRLATIGSASSYGRATSTVIFMDGDTVEVTFAPLGDKAETYLPTTVTKNASQTNNNININASIPTGIDVTVTAPAESTVAIGDYSSYIYKFYDVAEVSSDGSGNVVANFRLPSTASGQRFIRVQNPNGVTYWQYGQINASKSVTITPENLHLNDASFTKSTVTHFEKNIHDMGNIYLNINGEGYMNMNAGDTYELDVFRNWQAIDSFMNSQISLPDVHYQVVDFNGAASDVVSITPDANNSSLATMEAQHAGTAVVLVTYDAMAIAKAQGGTEFSAIWPELTGVFVVSVGADGTSIKTNMMMNRATSAATKIDAEHDTLYYLGDTGASYSFTPEAGTAVSIARCNLGSAMSFNGFSTDGITVDPQTGEVTISNLTTGRHIVKVEKDGVATYQVISARQATLTISDAQGNTLGADAQVNAGDTLTVQFGNLLNPCEKLATSYNRNTKLSYVGEDGSTFVSAPGGSFGVYDFSGNAERQKFTMTVPKYWANDTYTLSTGVLVSTGFGDQPGQHRSLSYITGRGPNLDADAVGGVLSALPDVTVNVAPTQFITGKMVFQDENGVAIDYAKVKAEIKDASGNVRELSSDGTFTGFAEEYSFATFAAGYKYQTGSMTLSETGENVFTVMLATSSNDAWDGKTVTEPQKDEDGTYLISTGNELAWFALQNQNKVSASGKLTANIDLADYPWINSNTTANTVTNLDGAGYAVANLYATNGLIGAVANGSLLKNINVSGFIAGGKDPRGGIVGNASGANTVIENCVSSVVFSDDAQRAGGIVGYLSDATVKNCANYGAVIGSDVGGIVGYVAGAANLTSCANYGAITGASSAGGVFGECASAATISSCYNTASVIGTAGSSYAGGIGGRLSGPSWGSAQAALADCYSTGSVTSDGTASGAFGSVSADHATVARAYYLEGAAESDPVAEKLTAQELQQPDITLSDDGFGLTCNGYPRLHWEDAEFHNMTLATTVAPACLEKGYSTYTCDKCGNTVKANYVAALGHDFCGHTGDDPECDDCVYTAPTCTSVGYVVQTCRRAGCSDVHVVTIPATGHTEDTSQTVVHDGYRTCVCATCGETFTMGSGTLLDYVKLPNAGIETVSESLDATYAWAYNASEGRIESQNVGANSTTARASVTFKFANDEVISFDYGVSSEKNYDKLTIKQTVDGTANTLVNGASGEDTGTYTATLEAGKEYTLTFEFSKDSSTAGGQDKAWVSGLNIADAAIAAQSVSLDGDQLAMGVGAQVTLVATVSPDAATDKAVIWTTDNKDVVTVANGVVTAKGTGRAHITATVGDASATCEVAVLDDSLRGDANGNGRVNIVDAQVVYDLARGTYGADYASFKLPADWNTSILLWVANVNDDDAIDATDAFAIQYFTHYGSYGVKA